MHKMASKPITLESFEIDDYKSSMKTHLEHFKTEDETWDGTSVGDFVDGLIDFLEDLRKLYLETEDVRYWKELIRWLPESWLQTRTVTMSYENLFAMCGKGQRRFHKLTEWRVSFIDWARTLPYAQEFIFIDELELTQKQKIDEMLNSLGVKTVREDREIIPFGEVLNQLTTIYANGDKESQDKIVKLILN